MLSFRKGVGPLLVGVLAFGITACGQRDIKLADTGNSLTGTVKYNSETIYYALIIVNQGLTQSPGMVREDGTYWVGNVQLGEAMIGINSDAGRGKFMADSMAAGAYAGPEAKGKDAGKKKTSVKFIDIPKKYQDPNNSGVKTNIEKGENKFDIVLSK